MTLTTDILLSDTGAVARRLAGFEVRPQQLRMAAAVEAAFENRQRLFVEAGTGVGKSFAYLIPAIRRIVERGERVVVATHTISLQEQLLEKDVPLLNAVIPEEFSAVLVKGRGNYLSLRRLKLASEREARLFSWEDDRNELRRLEDWAYRTDDGSLASLPQLPRPEVWDHVESDAHNCMGRRCPTFDKCFYQAARRRMENGQLLITNHALFFADLAMRSRAGATGGVLPPYDHVILDEAHEIEDVASEHFGLRLGEGAVRHLLRTLYQTSTGRGFLSSMRGGEGSEGTIEESIRKVRACESAVERQFDALWRWHESNGGSSGRMRGAGEVQDHLSAPMLELATALRLLRDVITSEADQLELNAYAARAEGYSQAARDLLAQAVAGCVYWVEAGKRRRGGERPPLTVVCAAVDVGPILREHLFAQDKGVVLTSATLATQKADFRHAATRLGCDDPQTLQLGSPFDYARLVEFIVDRTMPEPTAPEYEDELAERVLAHVQATDGGAFVLFTSFRTLDAVAERIVDTLAEDVHPLHIQGKGVPRNVLLQRFREDERSVLFGVSSFWQGVDVRGRALRNVIITRLPFEVPDRPIVQARHELIESRGGKPFFEDSLPRAVLRFKQGFGRLVRSSTDEGRVVVLDPRIVTKRYGQLFIDALPEGVVLRTG
jgi:ATP-dependent DNA helicase DinG